MTKNEKKNQCTELRIASSTNIILKNNEPITNDLP